MVTESDEITHDSAQVCLFLQRASHSRKSEDSSKCVASRAHASMSKCERPRARESNRSDLGHLLGLLALANVSCLCGGSLDAITECSRLAPFSLTADQRMTLCKGSTSAAPAECARKANNAAPRLSGSHILELCLGEVSELPGLCVAGLSRSTAKHLSAELRVELCKDARSYAPARCAEHSVGSRRQPQLVVDVCKGASSVAPAECLNLLAKQLSHDAAVEICGGAEGVGPALCANAKGQLDHGSELTSRLCRGASGPGPSDCFRRSALVTALSVDERVELCSGARSIGPARCAGQVRDRRIGPSEKVLLCQGASGTAPAKCLASTPPSMPAENRVELCQGAPEGDPTAAAACLKAVPHDLPSAFAVTVCRTASNFRAAVDCAKVARYTVGDSYGRLLNLCGDALSTAPADCAKAAFRVGANKDHAVVLCAGSTSLAPASCFAAAPKQIPPDFRVATCAGAQSTSPALCLAAALVNGLRAQPEATAVCPLDPEISSVPRRVIGFPLAARLCRSASDNRPAQCARAAPLQMSDGDVEVLCATEGLPEGEDTSKCAAAALMIGFSSPGAALLCRGARSSAPADCAATAAHRLGEAGRLSVCTGASSNAPARCINSVSAAKIPSAETFAECKTAVPYPSGLHITDLGYDGDVLFPDQPIYATLEVWDQWGGRIDSDSSTVVRASVAIRGSNGAVVNAQGRSNTSIDGIVHFSSLSLSGPGNLTLQFYIDGYNKDSGGGAAGANVPVPLEAARIVVAETEHGSIIRRCRGIFSQLACPSTPGAGGDGAARTKGTGGGAGNSQNQQTPLAATEAVSTVSGGTAAAWYVMTCQQVLEENGIYVAYVSSRSTDKIRAFIWYHPGIETLETGAGLPTRDQTAWERLGVDRSASAREVRRAYYRQSLLWHPDRWVRHAIHSARAQEVFQIVSEAYAWMVASSREGGETINPT